MNRKFILISLSHISILTGALSGQTAPQAPAEAGITELEEYITTAGPRPLQPEDMTVPSNILAGERLALQAQNSLGETLAWEPGVNSTYFGPGASRPVIRGFEGDRVRVLQGGVDTLDVSSTSPDHAVAVEPLLVERIEVLRGPATLLYGSSAIGGAVNVTGRDIPRELPEKAATGAVELRYGSAADEKTVAGYFQGAAGKLAWSLTGLHRETNDYEIPGFAELEEEGHDHDEEEEDHEEEHEEIAGVLENSFVKTDTGSAGLAWFWKKGSIGFSVSTMDSLYGVPGHGHEEGLEEEEEGESVRIDLDQMRFDMHAEAEEPLPFLESATLRFGYSDYKHTELEGGETGTLFLSDGFELRAEAAHQPLGGFEGAFGLQVKETDLEAIGEEAFIPANKNTNWALFVVERVERAPFAWEFGLRYENQHVDAGGENLHQEAFSASTGAVVKFGGDYSLAFSVARSERLPSSTELLAFGPHAATRAFEVGNAGLGNEQSTGLDIGFRKNSGRVTGALSFFYSNFDNFIFLQEIEEDILEERFGPGFESDGLEVFEFVEREAEFYGFEAEADLHLLHEDRRHLHLKFLIDYVRATNETDHSPLPRIPPLRFGTRLEYETPRILAGIEGRVADRQERVSSHETATAGYYHLNADFRYSMPVGKGHADLFIRGANLTDEEARVHTSFLKALAPLPGRNITMGVRTTF